MSRYEAFDKGRSSPGGKSSISSSSKPNCGYSAGLTQEAIDVLENGWRFPGLPTLPDRFRFKVPSPASRQFAPVPSPLEYYVPYTENTRLVTPVVADHLNSKLASSTIVYGKYRHVDSKSFFSKMVDGLINAIHPPLMSRDARLLPSTSEEIVDYLSDHNTEPCGPEVHSGTFGGMGHEERQQNMLVFDVFTTENRALKAFAIGSSPQSPLYIFYPLKHPYDEALLETVANRAVRNCIYPPYTPGLNDIEEQDLAEEIMASEKKNDKDNFWSKGIKKLCKVTKRKPIAGQKLTAVPLQNLPSVTAPPAESHVTHALSQFFLQFRDPLEGFRAETISGGRWSSLWINQRLRNSLNDPPAPEPTEGDLTALGRRAIRVAYYEARLAKLSGVQKWFYELLHKRSAYKEDKIKGEAVACELSGGSRYAPHQARQDAGAMFTNPDVTIPQDARVAEYILPALDAEKKKYKRAQDRSSHFSTNTGYSSLNDASTVTSEGSAATSGTTLQRKHPILRRDLVLNPPDPNTRRPQTIHDISTLIGHLKLTLPNPTRDEATFHTEYVIADEYVSFRHQKNPAEVLGDEPGIQIVYEAPAFRTEVEKQCSGIDYISGRYLWVYKMTIWAVVYERRKPSKRESLEIVKMQQEERKEWEEAQSIWGNGDWKSKGEKLQKKLARDPPKNFGRVKLYNPTGSEQDLLAYLDLEKGQLSIRRDVTKDHLNLVVLAMFSVLNMEEAVAEEQKVLQKLEVPKDRAGFHDRLAVYQNHPEENPTTVNQGVQITPTARSSESGLQGPAIQLFGSGETTEQFVIVGDNNAKTYFGSAGVEELVRRTRASNTSESDSGSDMADSDDESGCDSIQEIVRRTSRGWRRVSEDSKQRKTSTTQKPACC